MRIYSVVHNRDSSDPDCFDSNGDEIICSFESENEAKRAMKAYLEKTLNEYDFDELRETYLVGTDEELVEKAVEAKRADFEEWSVRIDAMPVYNKLEDALDDHRL